MGFDVARGTNISHWLSQSKQRGAPRRGFFTRDDVQRIAEYGFDHIRLPIDEEQMFGEAGEPEAEAFELLESALDWCGEASLRVVVDLHILRSHHFLDADPPLYTDPAEAERFAGLWQALSDRLRGWPVDQLAYELLNEPVAHEAGQWNRVARQAYEAVRQREPGRLIVLGSNRFQSVDTFNELDVPGDDPAMMLSLHYYRPMAVTHYRASWTPLRDYAGPIQYPGEPVPAEELAKVQDAELRRVLEQGNKPVDRQAMARDLAQPLAKRAATGLKLYCGEFGCVHHTPVEIRLRWYRDFVSVLEEHDIAWANWDYKGGFGIVDGEGRDTGIAAALLGART